MSRRQTTIPAQYFEDLYQNNIDPWQFRTSPYELDKYQATIAALTQDRYEAALEVGCSIGILTGMLAGRCKTVIAVDASETAISEAKLNGSNFPHASFKVAVLPEQFPAGRYDLIILSEILYYFVESDLKIIAQQCFDSLTPAGEIVLCHWLGRTDYPLTGGAASDYFAEKATKQNLDRLILHDEVYRLERFLHRN